MGGKQPTDDDFGCQCIAIFHGDNLQGETAIIQQEPVEVRTESKSWRKSTGIVLGLSAGGVVPVTYSVITSPSES